MKTAICTIVAEFEKPYLYDFCFWHLECMKFDRIFIYANNWKENTDFNEILKDLIYKVKIIRFDGNIQQLNSYNDFITTHSQYYDWVGFVDCDEYFYSRRKDLQVFFNEYQDFPQLGLNWLLFGSSGEEHYQDIPIVSRFVRCEGKFNIHTKQFLNFRKLRELGYQDKVRFVNPHFTNIVSTNLKKNSYSGPFNSEFDKSIYDSEAYLAHYITKSRDECKERRTRNRADTGTPREEGWETFFSIHDRNEVFNNDLQSLFSLYSDIDNYNGITILK